MRDGSQNKETLLKVMLALSKASLETSRVLVTYSDRELATGSNRHDELADALNNVGMLVQEALDQLDVVRVDLTRNRRTT
jgi:hypothetical protein